MSWTNQRWTQNVDEIVSIFCIIFGQSSIFFVLRLSPRTWNHFQLPSVPPGQPAAARLPAQLLDEAAQPGEDESQEAAQLDHVWGVARHDEARREELPREDLQGDIHVDWFIPYYLQSG